MAQKANDGPPKLRYEHLIVRRIPLERWQVRAYYGIGDPDDSLEFSTDEEEEQGGGGSDSHVSPSQLEDGSEPNSDHEDVKPNTDKIDEQLEASDEEEEGNGKKCDGDELEVIKQEPEETTLCATPKRRSRSYSITKRAQRNKSIKEEPIDEESTTLFATPRNRSMSLSCSHILYNGRSRRRPNHLKVDPSKQRYDEGPIAH